jgi:N-omega-hydroxy-L-arginine synthase
MLLSQEIIENNTEKSSILEQWMIDTALQVLSTIGSKGEFPCPFSQAAAKNRRLLFSFIADLTEKSLHQSAADLQTYLVRAAEWDGKVASAEPLLMVFNPHIFKANTVANYHAIGWKILQFWHDIDTVPWPNDVSVDPHSPFWSMCFGGVQIFVNMSNPAHETRRSRNLGQALIFVINPRERFDRVAGDNPQGWKIREMVRDRIKAYDGLSHSPVLGSFEAGEIEWWQYGLTETNGPRADRCPFRTRSRPDVIALDASDTNELTSENHLLPRKVG